MPYMAAIDFDSAGDMVALTPQGKTKDGIKSPERTHTPVNAFPEGEYYTELLFTVLSQAEKNTLDGQMGVSETALMTECTMKLKKNDGTWGDFNVRVEYPEVGKTAVRSEYGWSMVTYFIYIVEAL